MAINAMDFWLRLSGLIDTLNRRVGVCASWLVLVMTIISALNALTRKFLNLSSNAFLEIQWYLFAAVFLLVAGYTLLGNEHVRVDIINTHLRTKVRIWIEIFGFGLNSRMHNMISIAGNSTRSTSS